VGKRVGQKISHPTFLEALPGTPTMIEIATPLDLWFDKLTMNGLDGSQ
jgi:hypothetical protein